MTKKQLGTIQSQTRELLKVDLTINSVSDVDIMADAVNTAENLIESINEKYAEQIDILENRLAYLKTERSNLIAPIGMYINERRNQIKGFLVNQLEQKEKAAAVGISAGVSETSRMAFLKRGLPKVTVNDENALW